MPAGPHCAIAIAAIVAIRSAGKICSTKTGYRLLCSRGLVLMFHVEHWGLGKGETLGAIIAEELAVRAEANTWEAAEGAGAFDDRWKLGPLGICDWYL